MLKYLEYLGWNVMRFVIEFQVAWKNEYFNEKCKVLYKSNHYTALQITCIASSHVGVGW